MGAVRIQICVLVAALIAVQPGPGEHPPQLKAAHLLAELPAALSESLDVFKVLVNLIAR
jgi:hypothetical protein